MKTVHVSRPEMQPAPSGSDEVNRSTPAFEPIGQPDTLRDRRVFVIFGVVAAVVVVGILIVTGFYLWLSKGAQSSSANPARPLTQSPSGISSSLPHPTAPDGMAYIPGGQFMMGRDDGDEYERPAHQVAVKPFFIDLDEVTNQQYQEFVNQTGHAAPEHWTRKQFPAGKGQLPVTNVNWDDANAYAKWAGKRLPTEAEWEFAARGTDGRRYPWGNDWQEGLANAGKKIYLVAGVEDLADVGSHKGASPYGLLDTVGNAWEWTADEFSAYPGGQVPEQVPGVEKRVIRGGNPGSDKNAGVTLRRAYPARGLFIYYTTGFRCAKDLN
jgi:serine/threonine-protein kinase